MEAAFDHLPEAFGRVTMLYVNIEVNGHAVKAFVDSGAQSTIMSMACAERCGITRLIDKRFSGQARGVGTANIIGRIHIAQMKFGNSFFPISITVLENNDVDFLFGLDTLRRYRCCIDLEKNVLRIDGVNGQEEIPFLPENELPPNARGTGTFDEATSPK
jgi:DNA damage-inducible protein 1